MRNTLLRVILRVTTEGQRNRAFTMLNRDLFCRWMGSQSIAGHAHINTLILI